MGTPWRSKKFHEAYFGNLGDNTLPDQVTGMRQLAGRYPWIDLDRAGIYGHSGGGYATAGAMFHYPDFFKVGISEAGNHDNREYEDDWAEKWQGLLKTNADGTTNYDNQANQLFAKNLKGHLLLAHGTMDNNVPPYNTLLVVNELIKANKDFDLLLLPNRNHGFGNEAYMVRRRWDYFVRYLVGASPRRATNSSLPPAADAEVWHRNRQRRSGVRSMWGRLSTCAAVDYRRRPDANTPACQPAATWITSSPKLLPGICRYLGRWIV